MKNKIGFITESGPEIGYGHLYRSLALAEEFITKGEQIEFVSEEIKAKKLILNSLSNVELTSFDFLEKNLRDYKIVFIDVFNHSWKNYKKIIKSDNAPKIVSIIDFSFLEYAIETDYIFAIGLQSYNFKEEFLFQEKEKKSKMFSGNEFFIFRDEFSKTDPPETKREVDNIFISMGGSDPLNLTVQSLEGLDEVKKKLNLKVILGAGYDESRITSLKNLIYKSKHRITLYKNVSNISNLMAECDFAIINGGNTRFELAYLGIPFISISINKKQKEISENAEKRGIGKSLGVYNEISKFDIAEIFSALEFEKRETMSKEMKDVIKVNGANKIFKILSE